MKKLQKHLKMLLCLMVSAVMLFTCALVGCGEQSAPPVDEDPPTVTPGPGDKDPDDKEPDDKEPDDKEPDDKDPDEKDPEEQQPQEKPFAVEYRADYAPEAFGEVTNEITELGSGVHLVANKLKKTNGQDVVVYAIEVDLNKANIVAGTKNNAAETFAYEKAAPYAMAQAWEKQTGGHVYSSLNADFFGSYCVNAFVKDGFIIKDGHNDNGNYDYREGASDVPASAPMLFGVKGTTAQIAPIQAYEGDPTSAEVKKELVKAKLSYAIAYGDKLIDFRQNATLSASYISLRTEGQSGAQRKGYAVKVDTSAGITNLTVLEVTEVTSSTRFTAGAGYGYLQSTDMLSEIHDYLASLKPGDKISLAVSSPDGTWDGYETILGCRQALVVNDAIAETVKLENSNSAQSPDVPRSAVGIKPDGNVVIFAVESMYYGKKNKEGDTHGMNLPELAQFAYYYGCTQAANFDGGGSTQLVVRGENEETGRVIVRSSDTASTGLTSTRVVMNGILVTSRKEG